MPRLSSVWYLHCPKIALPRECMCQILCPKIDRALKWMNTFVVGVSYVYLSGVIYNFKIHRKINYMYYIGKTFSYRIKYVVSLQILRIVGEYNTFWCSFQKKFLSRLFHTLECIVDTPWPRQAKPHFY